MNNSDTILLFKGVTQYGAINHFTYEYAAAFQRLGFKTVITDLTLAQPDLEPLAKALVHKEAYFAFCINGIGQSLSDENINLYDKFGVPVISWYVDPYYSHRERVFGSPRRCIRFWIDHTFARFVEDVWRPGGYDFFLPHSTAIPNQTPKPISERSKSLVFAGSYEPSKKYRQELMELPVPLTELSLHLAELSLGNSETDIGTAMLEAVNFEKINPIIYSPLLEAVDRYVRYTRREKLLESIELPVEIYGAGWDEWEGKKDNHLINPALSMQELQEVFADTKIVLNNIPGFPTGSHERPLMAMAQGACVYSDTTGFFFEHFGDCMFIWDESRTNQQLDTLIEDDDLQADLSEQLQRKIKEHSYDHRAKHILKKLDELLPEILLT